MNILNTLFISRSVNNSYLYCCLCMEHTKPLNTSNLVWLLHAHRGGIVFHVDDIKPCQRQNSMFYGTNFEARGVLFKDLLWLQHGTLHLKRTLLVLL